MKPVYDEMNQLEQPVEECIEKYIGSDNKIVNTGTKSPHYE